MQKNDVQVAVFKSRSGNVNTSYAYWTDLSGNPLPSWSDVLTEATPQVFQLVVVMKESNLVSNLFSLSNQSTLNSDFSFDLGSGKSFPQTGPDFPVSMTSSVTGGTPSYSYQWMQGIEWGVVHSSAQQLGSSATQDVVLGVDGFHSWGGVVLTLRVEDSAGNVSFAQKLAVIDKPYHYGNPQAAGVPSSEGVALSNGNLHLSYEDLRVKALGPDFRLTRSFNSALWEWRFNVEQRLIAGAASGRTITHIGTDGSRNGYFLNEDAFWHGYGRSFDILRELDNGQFGVYSKAGLIHIFDAPEDGGKLQRIADREGRALTLTYSGDTLSQITDAQGRIYTFTSNADGKITRVADFTGRDVQYTWLKPDSVSYLETVTDARGQVTRYSDTETTFIITDPRSHTRTFTFGASSPARIVSILDEDSKTTTITYIESTSPHAVASATVKAPSQSVGTVYSFDLRGRLTGVTDELNQYRSTVFIEPIGGDRVAEVALPTEVKSPRGVLENFDTRFTYIDDGRGNRHTSTNALNEATELAWNTQIRPAQTELTNQNLLSRRVPPGLTAGAGYDYAYTPTGLPSGVTDPLGNNTSHSYNGQGLKSSTTNPRTYSTQFFYDPAHNLNKVTDAKGEFERYTHDSLGRVKTRTDKRGNTTHYTYDAAGSLKTLTDPLGNLTQHFYDENGNRSRTIDPNNNTTDFTYSPSNRLETSTVTVNSTVYTQRYTYDDEGRVSAVTNRNNRTSTTQYDPAGRVFSETDPLLQRTSYTYDANGNVLTITDAEGRVTTSTYDKLDRIETRKDHLDNLHQYDYNPQGKVSRYTDPRGNLTDYQYDDAGRLRFVKVKNGAVWDITEATYDPNGNLKTLSDPKGQVTTHTYDELDRRTQTVDALGNTWTYSYDKNGNQTQQVFPDNQRIERDYDANNRLSGLREYAANGSQIRSLSYGYDGNGNRSSISDGTTTKSYSYDALNRVKTATDHFGNTLNYGYDGIGNLTQLVYPGNKTVSYSYDNASRLKTVNDWQGQTARYSRNDAGQLTLAILGNGTQAAYHYDAAGRLDSLTNRTGNNQIISSHQLTLDNDGNITQAQVNLPLLPSIPTVTDTLSYNSANRLLSNSQYSFGHDDNGRVTRKSASGDVTDYQFNSNDLITSISENGSSTASYLYDADNQRIQSTLNGTTTRYLVDSNASLPRVLAETDDTGTVQRYYIYGEGLLSQIDAQNNRRFYHYDPTGNALALTNSSQAITDRYAYTPYGTVTEQGSTTNPFRYSGRWGVMDDGNGLNYMRARYYQPETRRFLSLDALEGDVKDPQTLNRYAYVKGNPIMGVDPSGRISEKAALFKYQLEKRDREAFLLVTCLYLEGFVELAYYYKNADYVRFLESKELPDPVTNPVRDSDNGLIRAAIAETVWAPVGGRAMREAERLCSGGFFSGKVFGDNEYAKEYQESVDEGVSPIARGRKAFVYNSICNESGYNWGGLDVLDRPYTLGVRG